MKAFLLLVAVYWLIVSAVNAESCYLFIHNSGNINPQFFSTMSVSLISQFIQKVEPLSNTEISAKDCQYKVSLTENNSAYSITLSGHGLNAIGASDLPGNDGLQQALLKAMLRASPDKKELICKEYGMILKEDCGSQKQPSVVTGSLAAATDSKVEITSAPVLQPESGSLPMSEEVEGVLFELKSCKRSEGKVTCNLTITSQGRNRFLRIGLRPNGYEVPRNGFRIFDDLGTEYWSSEIVVANQFTDHLVETLLKRNTHIKSSVTFAGFAHESSIISRMEIQPDINEKPVNIKFRNIPLEESEQTVSSAINQELE